MPLDLGFGVTVPRSHRPFWVSSKRNAASIWTLASIPAGHAGGLGVRWCGLEVIVVFEIDSSEYDGIAVVSICGEVDVAAADRLVVEPGGTASWIAEQTDRLP